MVHTRHSYSKDLVEDVDDNDDGTTSTTKNPTSPGLLLVNLHGDTNGHVDQNKKVEEGGSAVIKEGAEERQDDASQEEDVETKPRRKRQRRSEIDLYADVDYHCQRRSLRNLQRRSGAYGRSKSRKKFGYHPELRYGQLTIRRSDRHPKKVFETFNESEIMRTIDRKHQEMLEVQASMYDSIKRRRDDASDTQEDTDEDEDEDEDGDEEEEGEGESEEDVARGYSLRKTKPKTNRYQAPDSRSNLRRRQEAFTIQSPLQKNKRSHSRIPQHASPRYQNRRRRRASSTSSSDDDAAFERRKAKSMMQGRSRCLPMNFRPEDMIGVLKNRERVGASSTGASLADVDPMTIDSKTCFSDVGGLDHHINSLKEMVVFPLLYPEVFQKFSIAPPRGVLFYGPPGTGKTLVARALANECGKDGQKIAFFMRKGADCLSKWVGESERQLRLLFDQAYSMRPSIIFFDEIDGIAPVRSTRQDQIHSSIVSTLLALMDGLDARGEIVVIGATNRLDSIDPALRRPGRFDREFLFTLPNKKARHKILEIHTSSWLPKLSTEFIHEVAERCVGYCGADIKALCTEAALFALRRRYPQIYESNKKLLIDVNQIKISGIDFKLAIENITPASHRANASLTIPLSEELKPLLEKYVQNGFEVLNTNFPPGTNIKDSQSIALAADEDVDNIFERSKGRQSKTTSTESSNKYFKTTLHSLDKFTIHRPRFLLTGEKGNGQTMYIAPALLYCMEHVTAHSLDLPSLYGTSSRSPEEAVSQIFREAKRTTPSIIYLPHISVWWNSIQDTTRATFMTLLQDLPSTMAILLLATADVEWKELPEVLQDLFSPLKKEVLDVGCPSSSDRQLYFEPLFLIHALKTPPKEKRSCVARSYVEALPEAPPPKSRELSKDETKKLIEYEESILRELRLHLRQATWKLLADRKFKEFSKPVDLEEVDDYLQVIKEPMDLSTLMTRINAHHYQSCSHYLQDVDLITNNCLEYNPDKDQYDKLLRNRACELRDVAHALVLNDLEEDFEKTCNEIHDNRKARDFDEKDVAPSFIKVLPRDKSANPAHLTQTDSDTSKPMPNIPDPTGSRYSRRVRGINEPVFDSSILENIERSKRRERRNTENADSGTTHGENEDVLMHDTGTSQSMETATHTEQEEHTQSLDEEGKDVTTDINNVENVKRTLDFPEVSNCEGNLPEEARKQLSRLVELTENSTVQTLESIYAKLSQCLSEHRKEENRSFVLREMRNVFVRLDH